MGRHLRAHPRPRLQHRARPEARSPGVRARA